MGMTVAALDKAFEAVNHKLTIYDSRQKAESVKQKSPYQ
jgi:hypothetical protein